MIESSSPTTTFPFQELWVGFRSTTGSFLGKRSSQKEFTFSESRNQWLSWHRFRLRSGKLTSWKKWSSKCKVLHDPTSLHLCSHSQERKVKNSTYSSSGKTVHAEESCFSKIRMINFPDYNGDLRVHVIQADIELLHQVLPPSEYFYEFDQRIFQAGEVGLTLLSYSICIPKLELSCCCVFQ